MNSVPRPRAQPHTHMRIPIVSSVGCGSTLLSAFDEALFACGIANYILIQLSSVIPPAGEIVPITRYRSGADEHGHRLYVVKADARSDQTGLAVAAGLGWYQWGDGRGVFVEHETVAPTEDMAAADLKRQIGDSLRDLCAARRVPFRAELMGSKIATAEVGNRATSVIVAAIYQSQGWHEAEPKGSNS